MRITTEMEEQVRAEIAACKTAEELRALFAEAGVELPDAALDAVSGGVSPELLRALLEGLLKSGDPPARPRAGQATE